MIRRVLLMVVIAASAIGAAPAPGPRDQPGPESVRFAWLDVVVDSGDLRLAAYQIEVHDKRGVATIVGIEGGEHPVFADPPHYDPQAMMSDRVIIAAYSTAAAPELPGGSHRIARIHLRLAAGGEPELVAAVQAAADSAGSPIDLAVTLRPGEDS